MIGMRPVILDRKVCEGYWCRFSQPKVLIGVKVTPIFMPTIEIPGDYALIRSTRQQVYTETAGGG